MQFDMHDFFAKIAKTGCKVCNGKGWYYGTLPGDPTHRMALAPGGKRLEKVRVGKMIKCTCARKGYRKWRDKRIEEPCNICQTVGTCEHRPLTLEKYLEIIQEWEKKTLNLK